MPKVALYNARGDVVGDIELEDSVFGLEFNEPVVHEAVVAHLANRRVGTANTKTRGEVRGGGRKPWRQKGTGRARHGSIRSPIWRGGGIVFGPRPREFGWNLPKKSRQLALKCALSHKVSDGCLLVVDSLEFPSPSTGHMVRFLEVLGIKGRSALVVSASRDPNMVLSARNIQGVTAREAAELNAYDVMAHDAVVASADAVRKLEEDLKNRESA